MPVDPVLRAWLETPGVELHPPPPEVGAAGLRAALASGPLPPITPETVHEVSDLTIPGPASEIPVRLYRPNGSADLPLVVFFHGGGFVLGDLESHDALCRSLARASGCAVAAVDYRLAPEARFPAPLEDCYAAIEELTASGAGLGIDSERLAVCGDSAGGNLATVVAVLARDRGGPRLSYQALIYPVTDLGGESASMREFAQGCMLTRDMMHWFTECYLGDATQATDPLASPLRTPQLAGLPPATVITAEFDPLRDEGEAYAARLREAGSPVVARRYLGMVHGFMTLPFVTPIAGRAIADVGLDLRAALTPPQ